MVSVLPVILSLGMGSVTVESLEAPVEITLDARGVPTVTALNMDDAYRGEGYIHARDRFFQMDMMRRYAAGETAALAGSLVLEIDKQVRVYRGRQTCEAIFESLTPGEQAILRAYTEGVNAGLASLESVPPEYAILHTTPAPWTPVDSLLVNFSMTMTLTRSSRVELNRWAIHRLGSPEWVEFLLTAADPRDRPMIQAPGGVEDLPPLPKPVKRGGDGRADEEDTSSRESPGSNNWAVAGSRTADGGALLANDPHLMLTLPGMWYRIRMQWPDADLMGLSLPGLPGVIIGTNGYVAWGFTNATIDRQDYVIVEVDPEDSSRYRVPEGWESFQDYEDVIEIAGGREEVFKSRWTRWGPVVDEDHEGRPIAVSWTALKPEAVNINVLDMAGARTVQEAVEVLRGWYGPPQNVLLADRSGQIGWILTGWLPARRGFDGRVPVSWADGSRGWDGPLDESWRPVVINPDEGVLYSANNRTVNLEHGRLLGEEWASPDRVERIVELLGDRDDLDEADMLAMQLDTRVPSLELYRSMVLASVPENHSDDVVRRARSYVESWNGHSDAEEIGMGILTRYRRKVDAAARRGLMSGSGIDAPSYAIPDAPIRYLHETQPVELVPWGHSSWESMQRRMFEQTVADMSASEAGLETTWGERNMSEISHPLISGLPSFLRESMSIKMPQSGYWGSVRVAGKSFGASARLVVDPAHPERGILQTPGGQSGRYDSPNWTDFHMEWQQGDPTPLMPGPAVETIKLIPG
ncbi:MAG: penicillin acylase family protein [Planctomycetota bacterium]|nr:penicillin acylase family protein [Planctomycetota bacterium]